jgi:GTPase SAR1 family protein
MAEHVSAPSTRVLARPDAVHIVLFGMPAAGKTSLLGALAQAAQTQEHLLHGRIEDRTHELQALQHQLYEEQPRRTVEEVVPYEIDFEPFPADGPAPAQHIDAVLIDSDGRVANDLLIRRRSLPDDSPEGSLASEVSAADTLVLVIDASTPPARMDAEFTEFVRFLRLLERSRGERSEVGGLPVFLVLTKCDLLAHATDTPAKWSERIGERTRAFQDRFQQFLTRREEADGPLPFGRIDLYMAATAVKRPALADIAAKPREPYGVAELFRQCLDAGRSHQTRKKRSGRLLLWTVGGAGVAVAAMVGLATALMSGVLHNERRAGRLEARVESFQAMDGESPAERFRGDLRNLEEKLAILEEFQRSPEFSDLPDRLQSFVNERLPELRTYIAYTKRLLRSRQPADAQSEQDLEHIEETLLTRGENGLALPRDDWGQTLAARIHDDRLTDAKLLRLAVRQVGDWYREKKLEGERLWTLADYQPGPAASINWRGWHTEVRRFLSTIAKPPFPESERLPGSSSPDLTYQTVYAFDGVRKASAELNGVKNRLDRLSELTAALGLGDSSDRGLLVIPAGFTASMCAERVKQLQQAFPEFAKTLPEIKLPEAAQGDVRNAAETSYKALVEAGRDTVLAHLREIAPNGPETPEMWRTLRTWSANPVELSDWRVLARLLLRLADSERADSDPVDDLNAFLGLNSFELSLKRLTLEIPDSLKVQLEGDLTIDQTVTATKKDVSLRFTLGDKHHDARRGVTTYTLLPKEVTTLTYHPGDDLNAALPVRYGNDRAMSLTWGRGRSQVFQFEHLTREPRLHARGEAPTTGTVEAKIRLDVAPGQGSIPRLPDLMPVVKFDKKQ